MDTAAMGYQDGALLAEVSNPHTRNWLENPMGVPLNRTLTTVAGWPVAA